MTAAEWSALIANAPRPPEVTATRFIRGTDTSCRPVLCEATDHHRYFVKAPRIDVPSVARGLVGEVLVSVLGARLGAPVAGWVLVRVPAELGAEHGEMRTMITGLAFGSHDTSCCEGPPLRKPRSPGAEVDLLLGLYEWTGRARPLGRDGLLAHLKTNRRAIDHESALPGADRWSVVALRSAPPPARGLARRIDDEPPEWLEDFAEATSDSVIAEAVAAAPAAWGISDEERLALCEYLAARRDRMLPAPRPERARQAAYHGRPHSTYGYGALEAMRAAIAASEGRGR